MTLSDFEINPLTMTDSLFDILSDTGVFDGLLNNLVEMDTIREGLKKVNLFQISLNGRFLGFFSVEDLGTISDRKVVEVHAYIIPEFRKYSLMSMRVFSEFLFEMTGFNTIATQVPEIYNHIFRSLKMVGFKELSRKPDVVEYPDGKVSGMIYLYLNKKE